MNDLYDRSARNDRTPLINVWTVSRSAAFPMAEWLVYYYYDLRYLSNRTSPWVTYESPLKVSDRCM